MKREDIFEAITKERERQDVIHPDFPAFKHDRLSLVLEEFLELTQAINDNHKDDHVIEEMIQCCAILTRWLERL
jgi:NTP pyrophosphatase (non-canonical NTP hydrolase)